MQSANFFHSSIFSLYLEFKTEIIINIASKHKREKTGSAFTRSVYWILKKEIAIFQFTQR